MTHTEYIPNQWYAILESHKLTRHKPVGVERLGKQLVLWRDAQGRAVAQDAACPHRGANLALGKINPETGCLACPYHGFEFDAQGACTRTPCEPEDAVIRKDLRAHPYIVEERHGLLWLWYGDRAARKEDRLPWFVNHIDEHDPCRSCRTFMWDVSYSRLLEGMLDFHHLPFAHGRYIKGVGPLLDPYEATLDEHGVWSKGTLRYPEQSVEEGFTGELHVKFPGTIYLSLGEQIKATVSMCPIDETSSWGFVSYHQSMLRIPWIGKLLTAAMLYAEYRWIQPDDEKLLLSSDPIHSTSRHNRFVRADKAIAMWHKIRAEAFRTRDTLTP